MALILSVTALSTGLASCGKDDDARASAGKASAKAAQTVPLSTAPIDVVKTQGGMVSESFDPCVYAPVVLTAYFGFPADTRTTQKAKGRSCHYSFQRLKTDETGPFSSFHSSMSLTFDHGNWKSVGNPAAYDADIDLWLSKGRGALEIQGLGARTVKAKSPYTNKHSEMLLGFPVGGHWSAVVNGGGTMENTWPDALYAKQSKKIRELAANLNARLSAVSTVTGP